MNKKRVFRAIFIFLTISNLDAQNGFALKAGVGKYELVNVGMQLNYAKTGYVSMHAGTDFGFNRSVQFNFGILAGQVFRKPAYWKIKPGYSLGLILWTHNDEDYFFRSLSFPAMLLVSYPVTSKLTVNIEGGVAFNLTLTADRKQNVTHGYPEYINSNYRFSILYKLNQDEK